MHLLGNLSVQLYAVGLLVKLPFLELFIVGSVELLLGIDSSSTVLSDCPLPLFNHLGELVLNKLISLPLLTHPLFNVAFWLLRTERSERVVIKIHAGSPVCLNNDKDLSTLTLVLI